jgi:predicted  nucleic acid-binding Zn-ribbon protein
MAIYKTGSKLEKHLVYVTTLREKIEQLEKQRTEIEKELEEFRSKLAENENYVPEE